MTKKASRPVSSVSCKLGESQNPSQHPWIGEVCSDPETTAPQLQARHQSKVLVLGPGTDYSRHDSMYEILLSGT